MTKLFKTLITSLMLAGAILLTVPSVARAVCCDGGGGHCCGCRCSADANGCEAGACKPAV
jgi:hypothetical protein